jgi:DNA-binding NarL/FixJ family response regulator
VTRLTGPRNLTPAEIQVLQAAADGLTTARTATKLHLAVDTVKDHRARILNALGARSTTHAVAIAMRKGLIE